MKTCKKLNIDPCLLCQVKSANCFINFYYNLINDLDDVPRRLFIKNKVIYLTSNPSETMNSFYFYFETVIKLYFPKYFNILDKILLLK